MHFWNEMLRNRELWWMKEVKFVVDGETRVLDLLQWSAYGIMNDEGCVDSWFLFFQSSLKLAQIHVPHCAHLDLDTTDMFSVSFQQHVSSLQVVFSLL